MPDCASLILNKLGIRTPPPSDAMLYLGERFTPSGESRIIVVIMPYFEHRSFYFSKPILSYAVNDAQPRSMQYRRSNRAAQNAADLAPSASQRVEFYLGHPDQQDRSRFHIPYRLGDERGEIEGQLKDNGEVVLTYRTGPGAIDWEGRKGEEQLDTGTPTVGIAAPTTQPSR